MAIWPASLPQVLTVESYREQPPDVVLRTQMDAGPDKVRRRFTAGIRPVQGQIWCTKTQVATLDAFYVTTLLGGSLPFDWQNSRTLTAASLRFRKPPTYEPDHKDLYRVGLELEILP